MFFNFILIVFALAQVTCITTGQAKDNSSWTTLLEIIKKKGPFTNNDREKVNDLIQKLPNSKRE